MRTSLDPAEWGRNGWFFFSESVFFIPMTAKRRGGSRRCRSCVCFSAGGFSNAILRCRGRGWCEAAESGGDVLLGGVGGREVVENG